MKSLPGRKKSPTYESITEEKPDFIPKEYVFTINANSEN